MLTGQIQQLTSSKQLPQVHQQRMAEGCTIGADGGGSHWMCLSTAQKKGSGSEWEALATFGHKLTATSSTTGPTGPGPGAGGSTFLQEEPDAGAIKLSCGTGLATIGSPGLSINQPRPAFGTVWETTDSSGITEAANANAKTTAADIPGKVSLSTPTNPTAVDADDSILFICIYFLSSYLKQSKQTFWSLLILFRKLLGQVYLILFSHFAKPIHNCSNLFSLKLILSFIVLFLLVCFGCLMLSSSSQIWCF